MKKVLILIIVLISMAFQSKSEPPEVIHLKLKEIEGYGPFKKMFELLDWTPLSEKEVWKNTQVKTFGIPKNWIQSNVTQIWFDSHQFVYQNYMQGHLNEEEFNSLKASWEIDLKKRKLSDQPIHCFVHVAIGKNQNEELEYIIDTNYNNDFSDEDILKPTLVAPDLDYQKLIENAKSVVAQISTDSGIREKTIKIMVLSTSDGNFLYNIPEIAETHFQGNKILVSNGFSNLTYDEACLITTDENHTDIVALNEFIELNKHLYKNLGVNISTNELQLQKMPKDTILYSSRPGFYAKPFSVKQLETNDSLNLAHFKDKLLYLEFWGTWCAPCIQEIPNLANAYNHTDRNDIEFLSVAVFDTKDKLMEAIKQYDLNWPQVLDSDAVNFKESYNVTNYPTSFLIDKNGKIIAKNLRGENLLDTLQYYIIDSKKKNGLQHR